MPKITDPRVQKAKVLLAGLAAETNFTPFENSFGADEAAKTVRQTYCKDITSSCYEIADF